MSSSTLTLSNFNNPAGFSIKIREYKSEDSGRLCQMIQEEDKMILGGGLIYGEKNFSSSYDHILARYPENLTIIAEDTKDTNNPKVCACITLGIKFVIQDNKKAKIGVISNLKVGINYRGIGLATFLINEVEQQSKKRDIKWIYTYIDMTNQSYQELFKTSGYVQTSSIKEAVVLLKTRKKVEYTKKIKELGVIKYKEISQEELLETIEKNYSKTSLRLQVDDKAISSNKLKAYVIEDEKGDHIAGILQYASELQTKTKFKRFVLPSAFFENSYLKFLLYFISLALSVLIYYFLSSLEEYRLIINGSIAGGFHIATLFVYIKFYRLLELFKSQNEATAFEFFYKGDSKHTKDVIGLLRENFYHDIKVSGYRSLRVLTACKDNELNLLQHDIIGEYVLVSKNLEGDIKERVFIDPRDVIQI